MIFFFIVVCIILQYKFNKKNVKNIESTKVIAFFLIIVGYTVYKLLPK